VPTRAGAKFEVPFRFYGPEKPLLDKTWKLTEVFPRNKTEIKTAFDRRFVRRRLDRNRYGWRSAVARNRTDFLLGPTPYRLVGSQVADRGAAASRRFAVVEPCAPASGEVIY
jgi:hypothetical protein